MANMSLPAVILVGGAGRRMGGVEKPLLVLKDRPLLAHILERLEADCAPIALATRAAATRYDAFGLPILVDAMSDGGPLSGLASAFPWARAERPEATHLAILPGDTPFIPRDLIHRLSAEAQNTAQAVFAMSKGRIHYSIGLWPLSAEATLYARLKTHEDRSLRGLAKEIGFKTVAWTDEPDPFFNINTPEDLAEAERRITTIT